MSEANLKRRVQTLEKQMMQMRQVFTSLTDFLGVSPGITEDGTIVWKAIPKPAAVPSAPTTTAAKRRGPDDN